MTSDTDRKPSNGTDVETPEAEAADAAAEGGEAEPSPEERFTALEVEAAELKDKLLRTLAEAENIRKRAEKQVADARAYSIESFARDLLSVSDNFARAFEAVDEEARAALSEAGKGLLGGVEMTQKELHTVLARHGVTAIDAAPGDAFDPHLHQAVSQIPSDQPKGAIAEPFQPGWRIGERVLRAAIVAVSTGPQPPEGS